MENSSPSEEWEVLSKSIDEIDTEPETVTAVHCTEETHKDGQEQEHSGVAEIKKCHLTIPTGNDGEISDGVSVISEDEIEEYHPLHINWNKEELQIGHKRKSPAQKTEDLPLTPPSTPKIEADDISQLQIQTLGSTAIERVEPPAHSVPTNLKKLLFAGGVVTMLVAILINNYQLNAIKSRSADGSFSVEHEKRISELELEKDILRDEIEKLKEVLHSGEQLDYGAPTEPVAGKREQPQHKRDPYPKQRQQQLNDQKIVWSGEENNPLTIPDNILPDYCTKTFSANDDLYDEYNKNACEKIQRKIDERARSASKNAKKLAKEMENIRRSSAENVEIFVEIENDEPMEPEKAEQPSVSPVKPTGHSSPAQNQPAPSVRDGSHREFKEENSNGRKPTHDKGEHKKRMTKEEYEKYQKEKQERYKQQKNGDNKNSKENRDEHVGKNEYNDRRRKDFESSGDRKYDSYRKHKQDDEHHSDNDKRQQLDKRPEKKYQDKPKYTIEEQRAYNEMKQKEKKQYREGTGEKYRKQPDGDYKEQQKRQKKHYKDPKKDNDDDSGERHSRSKDNDKSAEWHEKRMEYRENARKQKNENWYLERGLEREVARAVDDDYYQKHI